MTAVQRKFVGHSVGLLIDHDGTGMSQGDANDSAAPFVQGGCS